MKLKSLKRYLAEQAQKAEAIEQVNKSHLRIEEAQEEAAQAKGRHDQYMQSLNATQALVIDLQRIITHKIIAEASRTIPATAALLLPTPRPEALRSDGSYGLLPGMLSGDALAEFPAQLPFSPASHNGHQHDQTGGASSNGTHSF